MVFENCETDQDSVIKLAFLISEITKIGNARIICNVLSRRASFIARPTYTARFDEKECRKLPAGSHLADLATSSS